MTPRELITKAGGVKRVAQALGKSEGVVNSWLYGRRQPDATHAALLTRLAQGKRVMAHIEALQVLDKIGGHEAEIVLPEGLTEQLDAAPLWALLTFLADRLGYAVETAEGRFSLRRL